MIRDGKADVDYGIVSGKKGSYDETTESRFFTAIKDSDVTGRLLVDD